MAPIPNAPSTYRHREMRTRLQEVIDAVNDLDGEGVDVSDLEEQVEALEARAVKQTVVDGAAADTNIAIAGIKKDKDEIISVIRLDLESGEKLKAVTDLTAEAAITSDGNIQLADTATTGDRLLVTYVDIDGNA